METFNFRVREKFDPNFYNFNNYLYFSSKTIIIGEKLYREYTPAPESFWENND